MPYQNLTHDLNKQSKYIDQTETESIGHSFVILVSLNSTTTFRYTKHIININILEKIDFEIIKTLSLQYLHIRY